MSRIGKLPIAIPQKVDVTFDGRTVSVKGPQGELSRRLPTRVAASIEDGKIVVTREGEDRQSRANHGLARSLVANMVEGVSKGFERLLEINGVGYRVAEQGKYLRFDLGYSHPIYFELPQGVTVEIKRNVALTLKGRDKEVVGEAAATIRAFRKPEPYKGKGIKYAEEVIVRKVGKSGGKK